MRLDEYLVNEGIISSRSRARRFIENGFVTVNGKVVMKPAYKVEHGSSISIREEDRPQGYFKLREIQEKTGIIQPDDSVLDIGSSAGGFLLFASGIAGDATGIEYSDEFKVQLKKVMDECPNVEVIFDDAFNMDISRLNKRFDVILNDMTVDPIASITVLMRFLPLLKENGRILQVIKLGDRESPDSMIKKLEESGLKVINVLHPEKKEAYAIASKKS
jgi:23S rRNA (cytidine1920-2'-O)/16S rRNA (cytidine1409-2'-O)-methyltransferase